MIPSVTITNSVNQHTTSMVLNRGYWIRNKHIDNVPRPQKVSTKILGFGIFMVGIVVLSIGLIIGLEFPAYVSEKIMRDQCILNKDHIFYKKWYRDESFTRYNRIYYWHITNPQKFIKGDSPQFVEKGPYVYHEKRFHINVVFSNNRISYQTMVKQTFVINATQNECGRHCSQYDNITIANINLLKTVHSFGSWESIVASRVPGYLSQLFNNFTQDSANINTVYEYLGCLTETCRSNIRQSASTMNESMQAIAFGNFAQQNDSYFKQALLRSSSLVVNDMIDLSLISIMYKQLKDVKKQRAFGEECDTTVNTQLAYFSIKVDRKINATLPYTFVNRFLNSTNKNPTFFRINFTQTCSFAAATSLVIRHLYKFSEWPAIVWTINVCDGVNKSCTVLHDVYESYVAYFHLANDFVTVLLNIVATFVIADPEYSVVHTKQQHELAIGYKTSTTDENGSPTDHKTDGFLIHHDNVLEAFHQSPIIVASTCLGVSNMLLHRYNGSLYTPMGVYAKGTRRHTGYTSHFPSSTICRACSKPLPPKDSYDVFIPDIYRSLKFVKLREVYKHDNNVFDFILSKDGIDGTSSCNLVNTTYVYQYPSFVGEPLYKNTHCDHISVRMASTSQQHTSTITIEPRTGQFWTTNFKFQHSTMITPSFIGHINGPAHHVTYVNKPLPLYWVHKQSDIVQEEIENYDCKIERLMRVSCGGLIGLITVSVFIMIVSVFVGMLSNRKNRIQPLNEEGSISVSPRL